MKEDKASNPLLTSLLLYGKDQWTTFRPLPVLLLFLREMSELAGWRFWALAGIHAMQALKPLGEKRCQSLLLTQCPDRNPMLYTAYTFVARSLLSLTNKPAPAFTPRQLGMIAAVHFGTTGISIILDQIS